MRKGDFWSFEKAREYVRSLGLKTKREWQKYYRENKPNFIPSNPQCSYKEDWKGYPDWMGYTFNIHFSRGYSVNERFFKKWSRNMAYVFGFWFADGYIYKNEKGAYSSRYIFGITQCEKYILEDILRVMDSNYPLHEEKIKSGISYRFMFDSKPIVKDILRRGGDYRKSRVCKFPFVPKKYLSDFVRGYFDGDGSVYVDCKNRKCGTFTSGSKKFIYAFLDTLRKNVDGFKARIVKDKRGKGAYYLSFDVNDAIRLRDFMYKNDGLCLKRKKEILFSFGEHSPSPTEISKNFLDFEEAKAIIAKENLKNEKQWREYRRSGNRPQNIPSNPGKTYFGKGWKGMKDWLRKE